MAIKNWHGGKVALVWVVCLGIGGPLFSFAVEDMYPLTMVLLGVAVTLLATPLVVSWKWFGAQEKNMPKVPATLTGTDEPPREPRAIEVDLSKDNRPKC